MNKITRKFNPKKQKTRRWKKKYQIVTAFRAKGESKDSCKVRVTENIKPRNRKEAKRLLEDAEKGLEQDYPEFSPVVGPMMVLEV